MSLVLFWSQLSCKEKKEICTRSNQKEASQLLEVHVRGEAARLEAVSVG